MNSKTNLAINEVANLVQGLDSALHGVMHAIVNDGLISGDVRAITAMELTRIIDSFQGFKDKIADAMYPIDDTNE